MVFSSQFQKIKTLYSKYERWITPAAFFVGFAWDHITLRRIDLFFENLTFIWNLSLAFLCISFINTYETGRFFRYRFAQKLILLAPIGLQFAFGALFSGFLVFYTRSSSRFSSWPFLLFLLLFFVGNEFFRKKYLSLSFHVSVFFVALFSYSVFAVPLLFGKIGDIVFIASGFTALFSVGIILVLFFKLVPERLRKNRRTLFFSVGGIYVLFQVFYFTNIIPPIPLSLKESGIYHSIERVREGHYLYRVSYEPGSRYFFLEVSSDTFHLVQGDALYSYSAVFAPVKFHMPIFHRWMYFDEEKNNWLETDRIQFPIIGGRDGGYRGYTFKQDVQPGKWRVEVITESGQVLGRKNFKVVRSPTPPALKSALK